jgi:transcriptional regulator with XRE-family HTH domain
MLSLASRICQARRSAGLSQAKLAARIGVQRTAVGQWERRNGSHPNTEHMIQVASICGVAFEWLATGRGAKWADGSIEEVSALQLNYYAHDELEERLLLALRQLPYRERIPLVALVEAISLRPVEPGDDSRSLTLGPAPATTDRKRR